MRILAASVIILLSVLFIRGTAGSQLEARSMEIKTLEIPLIGDSNKQFFTRCIELKEFREVQDGMIFRIRRCENTEAVCYISFAGSASSMQCRWKQFPVLTYKNAVQEKTNVSKITSDY